MVKQEMKSPSEYRIHERENCSMSALNLPGHSATIPSRRLALILGASFVLGSCSRSPTLKEKIASDPYLPRMRQDPMYGLQLPGALRQSPFESPYEKDSWGENPNAQITISHLADPGVDLILLRDKALAFARSVGYSDSGYRTDESGLTINCKLGITASDRTLLIILTAPQG